MKKKISEKKNLQSIAPLRLRDTAWSQRSYSFLVSAVFFLTLFIGF